MSLDKAAYAAALRREKAALDSRKPQSPEERKRLKARYEAIDGELDKYEDDDEAAKPKRERAVKDDK